MSLDLVEQLQHAAAYPHPVGAIQLRQTHISWVFLTSDWAYKVKQAKNLGFLDFSSLDARRRFCREELRLNRRFAPELYVDVVPVCEREGRLHIGGEGQIVDYAVKMRQFDDSQLLSHIGEREGLDAGTLRQLGRLLADTHAALQPLYPHAGAGTPLVLQDAMLGNVEHIGRFPLGAGDREQLAAVEAWFTQRIAQLMPIMIRRIAQGKVKDCHGDLHLGNIARIDGELRLFDCIEFSDDYRVMDTIAEAAFLVMDCQARGLYAESMRLLNDYLEYCGDYEGLVLFDLYRCYYATVRAKVSLLRLDTRAEAIETSDAYRDFARYLSLAVAYTRPADPFLAVTCGVSGSGKSTAAMALLQGTGAIRIRSDVERKRLFLLPPEARTDSAMAEGIYGADAGTQTLAQLHRLSRAVLQAGFPCIVDATFLRRKQRKSFRKQARSLDTPFIILFCRAGKATLRRRIKRREDDASEANVEVMEQQLEGFQLPEAREADLLIEVKEKVTGERIVEQVTQLLAQRGAAAGSP